MAIRLELELDFCFNSYSAASATVFMHCVMIIIIIHTDIDNDIETTVSPFSNDSDPIVALSQSSDIDKRSQVCTYAAVYKM